MKIDLRLAIALARKYPELPYSVIERLAFEAVRLQAINGMTKEQAEEYVLNGMEDKKEEPEEVALKAEDDYELPDYQCPYCEDILGSKGALTRHVKKVHKDKYKEYSSERS